MFNFVSIRKIMKQASTFNDSISAYQNLEVIQ